MDGVVRHIPIQDKTFLLVKKLEAKLSPKDIVVNSDEVNNLLSMIKLHAQLADPENNSVVAKIRSRHRT